MNREQPGRSRPKEADARIPDKPRDCGPNVDTWPILDDPVGKAPKPKSGESGGAKTHRS